MGDEKACRAAGGMPSPGTQGHTVPLLCHSGPALTQAGPSRGPSEGIPPSALRHYKAPPTTQKTKPPGFPGGFNFYCLEVNDYCLPTPKISTKTTKTQKMNRPPISIPTGFFKKLSIPGAISLKKLGPLTPFSPLLRGFLPEKIDAIITNKPKTNIKR